MVVLPSALSGEFRRLLTLKPIALRTNSTELDVYYETDRAIWSALPEAQRRPVHGYLFRDHGDIPLYRSAGDKRVIQTTPLGAEKLLGYASRVPALGMSDLSFLNRSATRQEGRLRRGADVAQGSLGYGYVMRPMNEALDGEWMDVPSPRMTLHVQQFHQAGGTPGRIQLTFPEIGFVRRELVACPEYGASWMFGEFITERVGQSDFVSHNPTQGGCGTPVADRPIPSLAVLGSPSLGMGMRRGSGIEAFLEGIGVPLEFDGDGSIQSPGHGDHGGDGYDPVVWWRMQHGCRIAFNFQQREGVHLYQSFSYMPFDLRTTTFNVTSHAIGLLGAFLSKFDKAYAYDASTDVLTQVNEVAWKDSLPANWLTYRVSRAGAQEIIRDVGTIPPTVLSVTPLASPAPSGAYASILRATGTYYGTNNDFAVGFYTPLDGSTDGGDGGTKLTYADITNARSLANGPDDTNDFLHNTLQQCSANSASRHRSAGWGAFQCWFVIDTFANVRSKIRQLYVDGHRSSHLGRMPFSQGYGS